MPVINIGGCCCPGGSGSGEGTLWFTVTCLDEVCGGAGTQYTCATSQLPNNWCVNDFGTTAGGSFCPYFFNATNLSIVGDICTGICAWGRASSSDPNTTANCGVTNGGYEVEMAFVCSGADPLSIGTTTPDNGLLLTVEIGTSPPEIAYYFIAADEFNCSGSNVLVLIGTSAAPAEGWASSITITPCGPDPDYPSTLCE